MADQEHAYQSVIDPLNTEQNSRLTAQSTLPGSSIASLISDCIHSFQALQDSVEELGQHFSEEITSAEVSDATGRFRVWTKNIGAHKAGQNSLDYHLRDASHIRERVQTLLQTLLQTLNHFIQDGLFLIYSIISRC